jgi:redox-sensitive bicupin YhaK (pirin superfamily)
MQTLYLDVRLDGGSGLELDHLPDEAAVYPVEGEIAIDGEAVPAYTMAMLEPGAAARVSSPTGARFVVIGGAPLDGKRFIFWNFVSSSQERIERAAGDWEQDRYQPVPGELERIPLPPTPPSWKRSGEEPHG